MKFKNKIKALQKAGFSSIIVGENHDEETVSIQGKNVTMGYDDKATNGSISVVIYTEKELIERETETLVTCYFAEIIRHFEKPNWVDPDVLEVLVGDDYEQTKRAKKYVKSLVEMDDKRVTNNLLRIEGDFLVANKFYLFVQ